MTTHAKPGYMPTRGKNRGCSREGRTGVVLVHVGTNNAEKEGTSVIVGQYRLVKPLKEARIGQIVLSEILPVM